MTIRLHKPLAIAAVLAALSLAQAGWAQPAPSADGHAGHGSSATSAGDDPVATDQGGGQDAMRQQRRGDGQTGMRRQNQGDGQADRMQQGPGDGQGGRMQQGQGDGHGDMMQRMMRMRAGAQNSAGGQDAFSAIRSVVQQLESNPDTDWSRINIDALREHLVDMQEVTVNAAVAGDRIAGGAVYRVTGQARTLAAIRRMVPAHAAQISAETEWTASTRELDDGVEVSVTAASEDQVDKIRALGFFGFMVSGEHHDSHHLAIAGADTEAMAGAASHQGGAGGHQGSGTGNGGGQGAGGHSH